MERGEKKYNFQPCDLTEGGPRPPKRFVRIWKPADSSSIANCRTRRFPFAVTRR
jgi:hypothetical protein